MQDDTQPTAAGGPISKLGFPSDKKTARTQAPIYAGLLVGGIIIGVMLTTSWKPSGNVASTQLHAATTTDAKGAIATTSSTTTVKTTPTQAAIVVSDQKAGPNVTISSLNIVRPTWVVVYVSREGKPGNALGARLFTAGDKRGTIGLLRNTQAGQAYFVGLSVDDGDRKFSLSKDKPLADADGGPLWATFRAL